MNDLFGEILREVVDGTKNHIEWKKGGCTITLDKNVFEVKYCKQEVGDDSDNQGHSEFFACVTKINERMVNGSVVSETKDPGNAIYGKTHREVESLIDKLLISNKLHIVEVDDRGVVQRVYTSNKAINEAEYQGKKVTLNKPFRTPDGPKKFSVYVMGKKGKVIKVNFGDPSMEIKQDSPKNKKSYCARSAGIEGGGQDKTKANYWSRRQWKC